VNNHTADEQRWSSWLASAQKGDGTAYEALLTEITPAIKSYLLVCFGQFEHIDDCVQESLLAIHQGRHTYDSQRPFRPWMFAIIRHRTIDLLRKSSPKLSPKEGTSVVPISDEIEAQNVDWNLYIDGSRLLKGLSNTLREPLILTKIHGLSTRECASQLGVSENVVKVRVHRGIRQLRLLWEADSP